MFLKQNKIKSNLLNPLLFFSSSEALGKSRPRKELGRKRGEEKRGQFAGFWRKAMGEALGSSTAIDSSNIGFQVFNLSLLLQLLGFYCNFFFYSRVLMVMDLCFWQLLKKHGWKEGTGLGVSEQVRFLFEALILRWNFLQISMPSFRILLATDFFRLVYFMLSG